MAPTPSSKSKNQSLKTPQSAKHRLHFNLSRTPNPSPNPNNPATGDAPSGDHPVEVIGRIRDHPDQKEKPASILQVNPDKQTLRVRADFGYRDFTLDGVSISEEEDLDAFYKKFVESRINGVKLGAKCTIMMYGPTGSGKSHTMFGCLKQPGIVYRSLKGILGDGEEEDGGHNKEKEGVGIGMFVQVTVLEIYNEEIYDLLSSNGAGGGLGFGWPKGSASKVRLEVMGKKAKNATSICGTDAGKILKEIQKVEKRRIVKSTLCNDRSSRSHCMIILDVPTVGGRLMLVDMAGSENIEQAGQVGFEAKMQTAKINLGNIALKRVVESIANGDSHVPFRDSKLTMLLQDSFEDDKSKILMILCASPDPKEIHKTISTLEYGAKAKCIVRGPHTPVKDKFGGEDSSSAAEMLGSRIAIMDQFIHKLKMENKQREKESKEAKMELTKKEQEVAALRAKLQLVEGKTSEEEINMKVNERMLSLRVELERKLEECQRMANEFVESERRRMEEKIFQQQQEVEMLRRRLQEVESQLGSSSEEEEVSGFAKRLGAYVDEDPGMVKSMDLDMSDLEPLPIYPILSAPTNDIDGNEVFPSKYGDKVCLSTVFEEEETEEEEEDNEEVEKQMIEEKRVLSITAKPINEADAASSRRMRIQTIFTLCGNNRELSRNTGAAPVLAASENIPPPRECSSPALVKEIFHVKENGISKENNDPSIDNNGSTDSQIEVYVKWEAGSKENQNTGKFITTLKIVKDASLADLRKLIEIYLGSDNQAFTFVGLGDPAGGPVSREKEAAVQVSKLPICSGHLRGHLACLRPTKGNNSPAHHLPLSLLESKLALNSHSPAHHLPLSPLENKLALNSHLSRQGDRLSPKVAQKLDVTPFVAQHSNLDA
ncbi:kinesin-like protein KIN-10A [Punica granatum]|uniref:Kinesin-like protein KIN-10A n=2 Tax=Punica granatum TaxID=22663 RepID=A0A218WCW2_PUNGR|nr:kinesin-like protein KIN-10A [Punica granatum]OWM70496.1 hypothetical protein CDL15_Pgr011972 [Punica granatum]PKI78609.1 hypothetical protein CRG98_000986 [Punica granatum]